ncbi:glycerol-3-phosphate acyltransferase [Cytobacillus purgationiresistens]|uniref:Glycerol-3-phosphate acyltransferase n=1 Tax=Cytobacillus purgationiresistens TaxID=863449 RepID=A0ABU0ALS6_9BACI|nr:glycerol-3-phosphate acyltransferase [Cytobacillus purgationiresistens]MDQ0272218.1 glycerol-3-phosphate acyltransferase PlsY [Cytobacillus purgationiresistens]
MLVWAEQGACAFLVRQQAVFFTYQCVNKIRSERIEVMLYVLIFVLSYAFGCVNGAYYLGIMLKDNDIRQFGSGNAGARNAGRHLGKKGFVITVIIDAVKVFLALLIANTLFGNNEFALIIGGFGLLLGHIWPVQLQLRGGKGVVVFLAAALYLEPYTILVAGIVLAAGFIAARRFTVPGLISILSIPVTAYLLGNSHQLVIGLSLMAGIVIFMHKPNHTSKNNLNIQESEHDGIHL